MKKETKLIIGEILLLAEKRDLFASKGGILERLDISDKAYLEAKQDFNKEKTRG